MPTYDLSTASPADVAADLLVLPIFSGREAGPGVEEVQAALGGDLGDALEEINEAFAEMNSGANARGVILF